MMIPYFYRMKKPVARRQFIKRSTGIALGTVALSGPTLLLESCFSEQSSLSKVDWRKLLRSHSMVWDEVPKDMTEAPHFGNGLLGSMIWVEKNQIRIQVFRSDVHDHADHTYGWSAYSRPRYQIGYFTLALKGDIVDCNLRQDLFDAELTGSISTSQGSISINHFVHRLDDLIYTQVRPSGNESITEFQWHPFPAKGSRGGEPGSKGYGQANAPYKRMSNPEPVIQNIENISLSSQDLSAGGGYATAWYQSESGRGDLTLLTTIQHTYPEKQAS